MNRELIEKAYQAASMAADDLGEAYSGNVQDEAVALLLYDLLQPLNEIVFRLNRISVIGKGREKK